MGIFETIYEWVFTIVVFGAMYGILKMQANYAERELKRRHTSIECVACKNRGGDYRPKNCRNTVCRFYREESNANG